eukprot:EG_transcript_19588
MTQSQKEVIETLMCCGLHFLESDIHWNGPPNSKGMGPFFIQQQTQDTGNAQPQNTRTEGKRGGRYNNQLQQTPLRCLSQGMLPAWWISQHVYSGVDERQEESC